MNSRILNAIVGGWQMGGNLTFADGAPTNVETSATALRLAGSGTYLMPRASAPYPSNQCVDNFWNIAAFDGANRI